MIAELVALPLTSRSLTRPARVWRQIGRFRSVREELRELGRPAESLDALQYARPAEQLGCGADELRATVEEWIHRRPLPYLAGCVRPGLVAFLERLREQGVPVGVYSDYPARAKLEAMGLGAHFALDLCSTDADVNAFKPHPAGFELGAARLGFEVGEVLYVGDREEVDAAGARAAGMECALVARGDARAFERLGAVFEPRRGSG
jgi:HAD superfamily hydrolase (TIGR01509 family)